MRKIKFLLLIALAALSLVSVVLFLRGGPIGFDPMKLVGLLPDDVDMRLSGVDYTEVTEGQREWTLKADTLRYFKKENLMVFDRVGITFFTQDGEIYMTGDQARYNKKDKKVHLIGKVKAKDPKGYILSTSRLVYDIQTRIVFAPDRFQITGPKLDLDGLGMSLNMKESRLKVLNQTQLLIKTPSKLL